MEGIKRTKERIPTCKGEGPKDNSQGSQPKPGPRGLVEILTEFRVHKGDSPV